MLPPENCRYEIRVKYPFSQWPGGDADLMAVAGPASFSGTNFGHRDLGFIRKNFEEALALKKLLVLNFPSWEITIREE